MKTYPDRAPNDHFDNTALPTTGVVGVWSQPRDIVRRRQLAQLESNRSASTLVLAPAGYGKSTLIGQWADARNHPVVWLSSNSRTRDLSRFTRHLANAFQSAGAAATHLDAVLTTRERIDVESALEALLADCNEAIGGLAIVLDDLHLISDGEVTELVGNLIESMPQGQLRLIVSSREPPELPIAHYRVQGLLDVVTAEDLRFSNAESQAFLNDRIGDIVSDAVSARLVARMEGWAAGLVMAVLALDRQAPDDFDAILERFGSNDLLLRDYLLEEVLERQSPEIQSFLLQTATCENINRELCAAIVGIADGTRLLEEVERAGLFLAPTDHSSDWFRYHQLFSDFLRKTLQRKFDEEAVAVLHRRASAWHASEGLLDEAIFHAISARDWNLASSLIQPEIVRLYELDRSADIVDWFEAFPIDLLEGSALLSFFQGFALARLGRTEEALSRADVAERLWEAEDELEGLAAVSLVRGTVARFRADGDELYRQAALGLRQMDAAYGEETADHELKDRVRAFRLPGLSGVSNMTSMLHLGIALRARGDSLAAEAALQTAYDASVRRGGGIIARASLAELGIVWSQQGRLHHAHKAWSQIIEDPDGVYPTARRIALIRLAELYWERNRLAEAEAFLEEAAEITRQLRFTTLMPEKYLIWSQVEWANGRTERAFERISDAIEVARSLASDQHVRLAEALRVKFWLRDGEVDHARSWAHGARLTPQDEPAYRRFEEHLTFARVLMASDESREAIQLLSRVLELAESDGRMGDALKVRIVLALAYQDLFELDAAVQTIEPALDLVQNANYARSFLEEGTPMTRLLRVAMRREVTTTPIAALLRLAGEDVTITRVNHQELVEPITAREIEVLSLIAVGLSNKEIADELYISVSTVKRHITNAYGKLGVTNRAEAIERAHALEIF